MRGCEGLCVQRKGNKTLSEEHRCCMKVLKVPLQHSKKKDPHSCTDHMMHSRCLHEIVEEIFLRHELVSSEKRV